MYVSTECTTFGGPAFKTEEICYQQLQTVGLPYLRQKFPASKIMQVKCIQWDNRKTDLDT